MWIISFLIPLIGIIHYFANKKNLPAEAKSALMAAFYGIGSAIGYAIVVSINNLT